MSRYERVLTESDFLVDPSILGETAYQYQDHHGAQEDDPMYEPSLHQQPYVNLHYLRRQLELRREVSTPPPQWMGGGGPGRREHDVVSEYRSNMKVRRNHQDADFQCPPDHHDLATKRDQAQEAQRGNMVLNIEADVNQYPAQLKPRLDAVLEQIKALKPKQRQQEETQRQLKAAHPDWLIVPRLKKLEIHGYWHISGPVLAMMLGHVFRNLETVEEFKCEGFETEDWIRSTQRMPWLQIAVSTRLVDLGMLEGECKLKAYEEQAISPFEMDTRARLLYDFHMNNMYVCDEAGSSQ